MHVIEANAEDRSSLNIKGKNQEPLCPLMIIIIIITVMLIKIMLNIVLKPKA